MNLHPCSSSLILVLKGLAIDQTLQFLHIMLHVKYSEACPHMSLFLGYDVQNLYKRFVLLCSGVRITKVGLPLSFFFF